MFAILISAENMPKITESGVIQARGDNYTIDLDIYMRASADYYLIRGYVPPRGPLIDWTVLPAYSLQGNFEYDPEKIKTDWTNLVRKE